MDKVIVKVSDLLSKVEKNREKHFNIYEKALKEYRKQVIKHLQKLLTEAKGGKEVSLNIPLVHPINHLGDYDRAIQMLKWTVQEEIALEQEDFAQYVMDEWHWKHHFSVTNSAYLSSTKH